MTFDELRAAFANRDLGFAVYAMEPNGPVTFEVHTPDGLVYSFVGATQQAAIDEAFPPPAPKPAAPEPSVFD